MGNRRRGSQAFKFEQSQETLQQNESIVNLYKNKVFVPPDQKEYETINEEGTAPKGQRAKRGQSVTDGSLVLGLHKTKRYIEEYKFWKQDDKVRNKRRKQMITKLWKGRKRAKLNLLNPAQEQKLIDLIADRVSSSDEEDESSPSKRRRVSIDQHGDADIPGNCVWKAVCENSELPKSKYPSTASSDQDQGSTCVWSNEVEDDLDSSQDNLGNNDHKSEKDATLNGEHVPPVVSQQSSLFHDKSRRRKSSLNQSQSLEFSRRRSSIESTVERELQHNTMFELQGLIPDSELAELLACDDLLFCSDKNARKDAPTAPTVLGNIENIADKNKVPNSRKSIRRSARLMCQPGFAGSVFNFDKEDLGQAMQDYEAKENIAGIPKKSKKRTPPTDTEVPSSEEFIEKTIESTYQTRKKRRSYSLDDGKGRSSRYSLDGSRKNRYELVRIMRIYKKRL